VYTLTDTHAPVRLWTDPAGVEASAIEQVRDCANLPWTHGVAVMPDVHHGYGATVGSVIAMRDAVSPGAVGVDIGCGMSAGGAVSTADGRMGISAGSMGTGSYIVSGKANEDANRSASHGADGRCPVVRRSGCSPSTISSARRRAWSAEGTPTSSTRSPGPTRTGDVDGGTARPLVDVEARLRTILCVKG